MHCTKEFILAGLLFRAKIPRCRLQNAENINVIMITDERCCPSAVLLLPESIFCPFKSTITA